jgi:dTMP kinase
MALMARGRLIVFEGIDGVGKETQAALLAKRLRKAGKKVTTFSSPRYDLPTGKLVRRALLGEFGNFVSLSPYISALPYLADFAAWRDDVLSALKTGDVICDRYIYSTLGYHSAKLSGKKQRAFLHDIGAIAFKTLRLPKAHTVVFLDVPVAVSQKLMMKKKKDQHEANTAYQKKVANVYGILARNKNWLTIACAPKGEMRSRKEIHEEIRRKLGR